MGVDKQCWKQEKVHRRTGEKNLPVATDEAGAESRGGGLKAGDTKAVVSTASIWVQCKPVKS